MNQKNKNDPLSKFLSWESEALANNTLQVKRAVCISTIDKQGFPAARFVDLKCVNADGFVFCTSYDSAKGQHIEADPKVALTVWWEHVGYQVRVVGIAEKVSRSDAQRYWNSRDRNSQLATIASQQSQRLTSEVSLIEKMSFAENQTQEGSLPMPDNWGAYCIAPIAVEFLSFKSNRMHERELFEKKREVWEKCQLQP